MRIKIEFKWFDFWVGLFYDIGKRVLYVCPLPMIVISFSLRNRSKPCGILIEEQKIGKNVWK